MTKPAKPLHLRQLKAMMEMKDLSLSEVVRLAGLKKTDYCRASEILNGRRIDADKLSKLSAAIKLAPMPLEVAPGPQEVAA